MILYFVSLFLIEIHGSNLNFTWLQDIDSECYSITMGFNSNQNSNLMAYSDISSSLYVIGTSNGLKIDGQTPIGMNNPFLIKYSSNGTRLWVRFWGSGDQYVGDYAYGVAVDPSKDEVYVTGAAGASMPGSNFQFLAEAGNSNSFLTKFDANGNLVWTKMWGGAKEDAGTCLTVDPYGSVFIGGYTKASIDSSTHYGEKDAYLTRFLTDGTYQWTVTWGAFGDDNVNGITIDVDTGFIYVTGSASGCWSNIDNNCKATVTYSDFYVSRFSQSGYSIWSQIFGTSLGDYGQSIALDARTKRLFVVGTTNGNFSMPMEKADVFGQSAFIANISMADGSVSYSKQWFALDGSIGASVIVDNSTGYVLATGMFTGSMNEENSNGSFDVFLKVLSADGELNSTYVFGTTSNDDCRGTAFDMINGEYYLLGTRSYCPYIGRSDLPRAEARPQITKKLDSSSAQSYAGETAAAVILVVICLALFGVYYYKSSKNDLKLPKMLEFDGKKDLNLGQKLYNVVNFNFYGADIIFEELKQKFQENPFVIKAFYQTWKKVPEKQKEYFKREVALLWFLRKYKNIVRLMGYSITPHMIALKSYRLGNLENFIIDKSFTKSLPDFELNNDRRVDFAKDLVVIMKVLHQFNLIHGSLNSSILMMDQDETGRVFLVLSDISTLFVAGDKDMISWNLSKLLCNKSEDEPEMSKINIVKRAPLSQSENNLRSSSAFNLSDSALTFLPYLAPELVTRLRDYSFFTSGVTKVSDDVWKMVDIYSFGIILFEIVTESKSWANSTQEQIENGIFFGKKTRVSRFYIEQ